jgi:hypothetical protein
VIGGVLAGAGRPPVNGGDIAVLMAMQTQMRVMMRTLNRFVHEKTAATAAAASRSAAGEVLRK